MVLKEKRENSFKIIDVWKMSNISKIVETALDKKHCEYVVDAGKLAAYEWTFPWEDERYEIQKMICHTNVETKDQLGCQMLIFNEVYVCHHDKFHLL